MRRRICAGLALATAFTAGACRSAPPANVTPVPGVNVTPVPSGVRAEPTSLPLQPTPERPPLAAAVPTQPPGNGTAARTYREILDLKKAGASDEALLQKVAASGHRYDLTTDEILELRGAGVSEAVIEAMLRSGR